MTPAEAHSALIEAFLDVAPDCDPTAVGGDVPYREALGIDSMDFLAIVEAIAAATGVVVPETDYPQVETFDAFVAYLSSR